MDIRKQNELKAAADAALAKAPEHRKRMLLFAGVYAVLSLLVNVISFVLEEQIAGTGGLSGMGLRSILTTVQSALNMVMMIALPFWNLGYVYAVLQFSKGVPVEPQDLLMGFRRFRPALGLLILKELIFMGIGIVCVYVGTILTLLTPLAAPAYEILGNGESLLATGMLDEATMALVMETMIPMMIVVGILFAVVAIPVFYRLRMADFYLMDHPNCRAREALQASRRMTRKNCLQLFKLDVSFWWFYLAQILVLALAYGDVLAQYFGIALPISGNVAYFGFYILSVLAQLALYWLCRNRVEVTYAKFYEALCEAPK